MDSFKERNYDYLLLGFKYWHTGDTFTGYEDVSKRTEQSTDLLASGLLESVRVIRNHSQSRVYSKTAHAVELASCTPKEVASPRHH